jgi:hypothetical protein
VQRGLYGDLIAAASFMEVLAGRHRRAARAAWEQRTLNEDFGEWASWPAPPGGMHGCPEYAQTGGSDWG